MKRFKFSMESLLVVRRYRKTRAAGWLAEASRKRLLAEQSAARSRSELASGEGELVSAMKAGCAVHRLLQMQHMVAERRKGVAQSAEALEKARLEEFQAREMALKAQREEKALLKLEAKQREAARKEAEKEDEKAMEEFVMSRHRREGQVCNS